VGEEVTFAGAAAGTAPLAYAWSLGDGTLAAGETVTHTYTAAGVYTVVMTVTNVCGEAAISHAVTVVCDPPHDAAFGWTPLDPFVGEEVAFAGAAAGTAPLAYAWDLGDGALAGGPNPTHTYSSAGAYTVVMAVTNDCGEAVVSHTITVVDECIPPYDAGFAWLPLEPLQGEEVTFSGAAGGTLLTYTWDLGDGAFAAGRVITHTYGQAGGYTVTMTVTNNCGEEAASHDIAVARPAGEHYIYLPLVLRNSGN
jgi:PKD repeat protein